MIIKANNLSASQFADQIGVQRSSLSHVLNGRNKPSLDFLSKIITAFPKVNASWLITGETREEGGTVEVDKTRSGHRIRTQKRSEAMELQIERIVMFYKDGSFSEYRPVNDQ